MRTGGRTGQRAAAVRRFRDKNKLKGKATTSSRSATPVWQCLLCPPWLVSSLPTRACSGLEIDRRCRPKPRPRCARTWRATPTTSWARMRRKGRVTSAEVAWPGATPRSQSCAAHAARASTLRTVGIGWKRRGTRTWCICVPRCVADNDTRSKGATELLYTPPLHTSYRAIFENHRHREYAIFARVDRHEWDRPSIKRAQSLQRHGDSFRGIRANPSRPCPGRTLDKRTRLSREGRDPLRPSMGSRHVRMSRRFFGGFAKCRQTPEAFFSNLLFPSHPNAQCHGMCACTGGVCHCHATDVRKIHKVKAALRRQTNAMKAHGAKAAKSVSPKEAGVTKNSSSQFAAFIPKTENSFRKQIQDFDAKNKGLANAPKVEAHTAFPGVSFSGDTALWGEASRETSTRATSTGYDVSPTNSARNGGRLSTSHETRADDGSELELLYYTLDAVPFSRTKKKSCCLMTCWRRTKP